MEPLAAAAALRSSSLTCEACCSVRYATCLIRKSTVTSKRAALMLYFSWLDSGGARNSERVITHTDPSLSRHQRPGNRDRRQDGGLTVNLGFGYF